MFQHGGNKQDPNNEFGYNEHPTTMSNFLCINLLVLSRTQCTFLVKTSKLSHFKIYLNFLENYGDLCNFVRVEK